MFVRVRVCLYVCACVCVCVCQRVHDPIEIDERKRDKFNHGFYERFFKIPPTTVYTHTHAHTHSLCGGSD